VVGAGLMGSGIAQVAAVGGWDVALHDTSAGALERARAGARLARDTLTWDASADAHIRLYEELL